VLVSVCGDNLSYETDIFYLEQNSWEKLNFSGDVRVHKDSFLSVFNISGLPDDYHYNGINTFFTVHVYQTNVKECCNCREKSITM
jgi:hypothetical protein